jgi:hypothetical protein
MNGDTTTHTSLLAALRRGVFVALCGVLAIVSAVALVLVAQIWLFQPRYCDPSAGPPVSQTLLGQVPGQRLIGSVWIDFAASDLSPASFSYSSNTSGGPEAVLKPALLALQDETSARTMQPLPYASLGSFITRSGEQCLRADPARRGYVVIEVWDGQVNLGYGGAGSELRAQAARVVASELERIH